MTRRFQFSLGRLMVAMTLLSVAIASISTLARNPREELIPFLLNSVIWSLLGAVGVFVDDRTSAIATLVAVLALVACGFFVCPSY
ncbi:MAG TPA: hypothetical protein VFW87_25765 [Pirellulales bacterium]|nr:hypothetical protein [Pirellulales bacterium]